VRVTVAFGAPGVEIVADLEVAPGATVDDAVRLSGVLARCGVDPARLSYALHGRRAAAEAPLADGDRVEILRPLLADPKTVRRHRAAANPLPRPPARRKAGRKPA
jgi:putative ubiquitin-RnfH superfamily antitoxin RatB of RatAB toxin-antitoxin module